MSITENPWVTEYLYDITTERFLKTLKKQRKSFLKFSFIKITKVREVER